MVSGARQELARVTRAAAAAVAVLLALGAAAPASRVAPQVAGDGPPVTAPGAAPGEAAGSTEEPTAEPASDPSPEAPPEAPAEPSPSPAAGREPDELPDSEEPLPLSREHQRWLAEVELLITEEEREFFVALAEEFRRDAFIEEFWKVRDPEPRTAANELKRSWNRRVDQALEAWGSLTDARARVYMLNGEPGGFLLADGREVSRCFHKRRELEIWFYPGSERTNERFALVLFRPEFPRNAPYRVWRADERLRASTRRRLPTSNAAQLCAEEVLPWVIQYIQENYLEYMSTLDRILEPPEPNSREWLATFAARSAAIPPGVETFEVEAGFRFPGRNQNRTAVEGMVTVPAAEVASAAGERRLLLVGEVVRDGRLFESFRYRYDLPVDERQRLPLVFVRYLRQGEAEIRLKVEDLLGNRFAGWRATVEVPPPGGRSLRDEPEGEFWRLLEEAESAAERGQRSLRLVPPTREEVHIGKVRFTTVTTGEFDAVEFFLDGRPLMTKRRPPFSVELDLGETAATHRLRAVAYDADGAEAASDEIVVNRGGQRFRVRLVEPRSDRAYEESLSAVATVEVPDGRELDRLEIFLAEQRVATLYQEPFVQPILLETRGLNYVRAVGYLTDGNTTEDTVFINTPDYFEQIDVRFVELYASVYDGRGRPVLGLGRDAFTVLEEGVEQRIERFEFVRDLPIHALLLLDTSASMEESLPEVSRAALGFVEQAVRPKDRIALLSFDRRPQIEVGFTNAVEIVGRELATLRAGGTTALYDSLVFALHYFDGMKGQKALLLLSDGEDEASRFDFDGALESARRAGVTVYVIGLKEVARDRDARKVLERLSGETGGRAFFIESTSELPGIYEQIQEELRSQYLLAYQSSSDKDDTAFRRITVEVEGGEEVRTMAGYYP